VIAEFVKIALKRVGVSLTGRKSIAGSDAVSKADQDRAICPEERGVRGKQAE